MVFYMNETFLINDTLTIPEQEISFTFSRSSKPGGQNVNKVNTRATLLFDVTNSPSLNSNQKRRIASYLHTRVSKNGILRVISYRYRTQGANRNAAVERFIELIRQALQRRKARRKTFIPRSSKEKRIQSKKQRSSNKQLRKKVNF